MDEEKAEQISAVMKYMADKLEGMGAKSRVIFAVIDGTPHIEGSTSAKADRLLLNILLERMGNKATLLNVPLSEEGYKLFEKVIDSGKTGLIFDKIMKSDSPVTAEQVNKFIKSIFDEMK